MTSGWKSGSDSSAICLAAAYAAPGRNQAHLGWGSESNLQPPASPVHAGTPLHGGKAAGE
jgi:hypothetical protein